MSIKAEISKYEYCVFDYDDTLMQTRECKSRAIKALAKNHYGKKLTNEVIEEHWGIAHHQLFKNLLGIRGDELEFAMTLYESLDSEFPLTTHDETKEVLEKLQSKFKLVVVSSCTNGLLSKQISVSDIRDIKFDSIFGAEDTTFHKPSGKVFDVLFEKYPERSREEFVYIGDGWKDAKAAMEAKMDFMGVDRSKKETRKMISKGARVFSSLTDIGDALV